MESWTNGFNGVDRIFNEMVHQNLDSTKSMQIHPIDAIQMYSNMIGSYKCQLLTVCYMVDQVAVEEATFELPVAGASDQWQEPIPPPHPACRYFISGIDDNARTITMQATVRNALQLFQISDDLQQCQNSGTTQEQRFIPGDKCREVATEKVKIMSGKLKAALLYKAKREALGSLAGKLDDLTKKVSTFSVEVKTKLSDLTRDFFDVLGDVLAKIGCRISVTKQSGS